MSIKLIDHHTHTQASPDADLSLTMENYIEKAIELGLPGVMFTDHVDFDFAAPIFADQIDYEPYYKKVKQLREKYPIDVLMGVEMGYQPHLNDRISKQLSEFPYDFVILSMHMCDGLDLYNGDFFIGKTQLESYQRYFETVLYSVENFSDFDVYGHIDYIIRYGGFENRMYDFETFKPIISKILSTLINKGKGIEINTSGLRYGLGVTHPRVELLKLYKSLGGKMITLGSDSHYLKDFRKDFELAISLLKEAGFTEITQFKNRKPYFISIL
ncbi:MAG: histidinol-phosphatase HisJ family protein [Acholeplasmataceae bacterium]|jgi:histidinol-phosphatase (PHP family)|nr:histidinol-phosphatase HisJ family protein [Acholeplasmataceae bacterium]